MFREIANAINKTGEKYPNYTMTQQVLGALNYYYSVLKSGRGPVAALEDFYRCFTRQDLEGNPVRDRLKGIMADVDKDGALELYRFVYHSCLMIISHHANKNLNDRDIVRFCHYYIDAYNKLNNGHDLNSIREHIYSKPDLLKGLNNLIEPIFEYICILIKPKEAKAPEVKSGIVFTNITDMANKRITNVRKNVIEESFGAICEGRIQLAAHKGNSKDIQEDAVLSMRRGDCTLNVVADGMGGYAGGDKASMLVVNELADWFSHLDLSLVPRDYESVQNPENNKLFEMIGNKLQEINDLIRVKYFNQGNTPGSTVVLSFSTPTYTLIVNIGDSTAYLKVDHDYKLISTIDASLAISKRIVNDYELYRNIRGNNEVSNCLGCQTRMVRPHGHVVDHSVRRKILLSSDGITDLINEDNFRRLFLSKATAIDFVDKALNPDEHVLPPHGEYERLSTKKTDNISAIIMDIPKNPGRKL